MNVTDMLNLSETQLEHRTAECGATPDSAHRLVLAVGNLHRCIGWSLDVTC